jgi:hypothetical protein
MSYYILIVSELHKSPNFLFSAIIPEGEILKIEEQERQQQLLELNLPPRSRKTVKQVQNIYHSVLFTIIYID